jgi:hypothetical protein
MRIEPLPVGQQMNGTQQWTSLLLAGEGDTLLQAFAADHDGASPVGLLVQSLAREMIRLSTKLLETREHLNKLIDDCGPTSTALANLIKSQFPDHLATRQARAAGAADPEPRPEPEDAA